MDLTCLVLLSIGTCSSLELVAPPTNNEKVTLPRKRLLIISTWRSGSSFVGNVFASLPETFYYYEPLGNIGDRKLQQNESNPFLNILLDLLHCDFKSAEPFLAALKDQVFPLENSHALRNHCFGEQCYNPRFLENLCHLYQNVVAKVVRLELKYADWLLKADKELQVVYLIRDPRAIVNSRKHPDIIGCCSITPDCSTKVLCGDMKRAYRVSEILRHKYRKRFHVQRFEDLMSGDIERNYRKLFQKVGMKFGDDVRKYVREHTNSYASAPSALGYAGSMHRVTKEVLFAWRKTMSTQDQIEVNKICLPALKLWNYPI